MRKLWIRRSYAIDGKKFFITHGDGILSWDHGYRIFKENNSFRFFILFPLDTPYHCLQIARFVSSGKKFTGYIL